MMRCLPLAIFSALLVLSCKPQISDGLIIRVTLKGNVAEPVLSIKMEGAEGRLSINSFERNQGLGYKILDEEDLVAEFWYYKNLSDAWMIKGMTQVPMFFESESQWEVSDSDGTKLLSIQESGDFLYELRKSEGVIP
jgi:hypothetical protein